MASRRLEKIAHAIQSILGPMLQNQISDPRVNGLISITRVEVSADLSIAKIYLSILGLDDKHQQLALQGITHAGGFLRRKLSDQLTMRTCPFLRFYLDSSLKKEQEILQILHQVASERDSDEASQDHSNTSLEPEQSDEE